MDNLLLDYRRRHRRVHLRARGEGRGHPHGACWVAPGEDPGDAPYPVSHYVADCQRRYYEAGGFGPEPEIDWPEDEESPEYEQAEAAHTEWYGERSEIFWDLIIHKATDVVANHYEAMVRVGVALCYEGTLSGSQVAEIVGKVDIAVLRYRLYEIDRIINRTLVYGALTAVLVAVYFGGVTTTQDIFRALTGQEQQPQLAIVACTLVIAALLNPLRQRIQSFIDRRFYRRKYDARKTMEAFSAKLREETDLDALNDDLLGAVAETMQPAHASLWLRPDTAPQASKQTSRHLPRGENPLLYRAYPRLHRAAKPTRPARGRLRVGGLAKASTVRGRHYAPTRPAYIYLTAWKTHSRKVEQGFRMFA